jgi:hypothetical protein
MIVWIILVMATAVILTVGIEQLLRRIGVQPEDPEAARGGLEQLSRTLDAWADRRRR